MNSRDCILFIPTNGAGLGHLTRCLAIARRLKSIDPNKEIIFFSTSAAMNLILQEGFLGYHIPSKMVCPEYMNVQDWNSLFKEHLRSIINLHHPSLLIFDGVYPYAGLITSMRETKGMKKIWIRRGLEKKVNQEVNLKEKEFDQIIIPKELFLQKVENKRNKYFYSEPIVYLDKKELLNKETIRKKWKVPKYCKLVFVSLGAGNINDINSTISNILSILKKRDDIFIVISESIIGKRFQFPQEERVIVVRDYPISAYYGAFDLAISASGYNSFHELLFFEIPSIFIPNKMTHQDNQVSRAMSAEKAGVAFVIVDEKIKNMEKIINHALEPRSQYQIKESFKQLVFQNGADQVATLIKNLT